MGALESFRLFNRFGDPFGGLAGKRSRDACERKSGPTDRVPNYRSCRVNGNRDRSRWYHIEKLGTFKQEGNGPIVLRAIGQ